MHPGMTMRGRDNLAVLVAAVAGCALAVGLRVYNTHHAAAVTAAHPPVVVNCLLGGKEVEFAFSPSTGQVRRDGVLLTKPAVEDGAVSGRVAVLYTMASDVVRIGDQSDAGYRVVRIDTNTGFIAESVDAAGRRSVGNCDVADIPPPERRGRLF